MGSMWGRSNTTTPPHLDRAAAVVMGFGALIAGSGSIYSADKIDEWTRFVQPRVSFIIEPSHAIKIEHADVRSASDHIANIKAVLDPAISDLADLFAVSRQAIYKWISGSSEPDSDNFNKLSALSVIADSFHESGINATSLLKMRVFEGGNSLFDLLKAGTQKKNHIDTLIKEMKAIEESYRNSGIASSKAPISDNWLSSVSIPSTNEQP